MGVGRPTYKLCNSREEEGGVGGGVAGVPDASDVESSSSRPAAAPAAWPPARVRVRGEPKGTTEHQGRTMVTAL